MTTRKNNNPFALITEGEFKGYNGQDIARMVGLEDVYIESKKEEDEGLE